MALRCLVLFLVLVHAAAGAARAQAADDPVRNFEYVWNALDRNYGQFEAKHVDWGALHEVYRPLVTPATTDAELRTILLAMLGHLNDAHVCIDDHERRTCTGINEDLPRDDFSLRLVASRFLAGKATQTLDHRFTFGWLTDRIGYLHIADFKAGLGETAAAIDTIMQRFAAADAMVVDVRSNPGGTGRSANLVADRFADRKRRFLTSRTRYGREHGDFAPAQYFHVEPRGPVRFTRPTILLTHRFSESAADEFILAMRVLPHVTVVGDLSAGAFSSQYPDQMPNGWTLWVAYKEIRDHEGVCWDGIGVRPDLRVRNTKADIEAGEDRVLEFAIRLLETGVLAPQNEASSLEDLRTSLVWTFARNVEEKGLKPARTVLTRALRTGDPSNYFSPDEAMQLFQEYQRDDRFAEAVVILEACREVFPPLASTYALLAHCHLKLDDTKAARGALDEVTAFEPMLPWEASQIARVESAYQAAVRGSAADIIRKTLADEGIAAAEDAFADLRSRGDAGPVFDLREFNNLGYELMEAGSLDAAVFVFTKNVQLHPDSWVVYDSLGEALAADSQRERAIENYRRSIELNPGNDNGRAILARLEGGE
ncbi:MAG: hypothetical protein JW819_09045 [Candidatus Krumholzibacteriota bacterium]|nr:hypothetical protein [Candidatus Krumholzibacteriota bacterium]